MPLALAACGSKEPAGRARKLARWDIAGRLNAETLPIDCSRVTQSIVTYDDSGEIASWKPESEDGTGAIPCSDDGTFTWHGDRSEHGADMVFARVPAEEG